MTSHVASGAKRAGAPLSARESSRLARLEAELARAQEERANQAALVEEELGRLSSIYEGLRSRYHATREARDRAVDDARRERERRGRETLELARKLSEAQEERSRRGAAPKPLAEEDRERFVKDRLASAPREHRPLAAGELPRIPGFRVIEQIGQGGMASVFRATRANDGVEVAIKLLDIGRGASRTRTELFLREAALMLQLDHPGLLKAFDAGDCPYGPYLVLQLIRGQSLASRVRKTGPLCEAEVVQIALDVGRALRYCARLGLTHRDVKPSNILQDPDGRLRLCDFGLAALSTGDSGRPYGSPGYASPEQLMTPDHVDERADIYALGCTMWHLVVGRRPFPGPPKKAFEIARETDLPDPRFEGADISARIAQVTRRMTRCDPSRRYRSWDECLLDLMLVEKGNPPFAAHLADALQPAAAGQDDTRTPSASASSLDVVLPPATTATSARTSPPDAPAHSLETADPTPVAPLSMPLRAPRSAEKLTHTSAQASAPTKRSARDRDGSSGPLPDGRVLLLLIACLLAGLLGAQVGAATQPSAVERLEAGARLLAAKGQPGRAAEGLRRAARLLPPDEASRLELLAEQLERR